jgi:hypothetical protein
MQLFAGILSEAPKKQQRALMKLFNGTISAWNSLQMG